MKKTAKLALLFATLFTLISCQGFLQSESIKNEIYSVIEYNNAPSYKIRFDSEKNKGTFKAPSGIEVQKKVTDEFTVSFAPTGDYDFFCWKIIDAVTKTEYANGEYLTLDSVTNDTTTCKFTKAPNDGMQLCLFAVVAKRPRVLSKIPQPDSVTYRDTKIRIVFDKPMNEQSIYFDTNEIANLIKELEITDTDFLNAGTYAEPKKYCYYYNGKKFYKNIQIVNTNDPETSILEYFDAPYFEDPTTLIIPTGKNKQIPPNTTLTVTLEAGFSYSYTNSGTTKDLTLKEDEIWLFSVNSSTDNDPPSGTEIITNSKDNKNISKDPSNPTTLYQQTIKMYVNVQDSGSGPAKKFKILFTNIENEANKYSVEIPYDSFITSQNIATLGKENEKVEYRFTSIPDGTYKMNFIYVDNNGTPTAPSTYTNYYVTIDTTPPTVKDIHFYTYTSDATSTANGKTALKFTYTCEDTDFEKVTATWYPADGSETQNTATFQKTETNFIIPNLTFGKLYTVDLEFFKLNGNSYKYTQNVRATYDYVRDFEITGKNINQKAEVTLSWDKPKGEFDKYIIGYKKASNTSNNYDKEYEVDNSETEYTIPVSLDLNTKYAFRISTYSGGSSTGYSKEFTTPIHTIGIDNFNISKNGNSSDSPIYLEVSSTVINSNYNYTVVMYYSNQEFELTDVTPENIQSGRLKYVSLSKKYYYYHTEYDATNTEIADNKYFNFGKTYYFLIGITNETKTDTQWSDIKSFTIAYTVKNLKIQTLMGNVKTPIVSSKNAYITWDYPTGVISNIVDSVQVFVNESTQPVWSINNSSVVESPKLFIENLNPDSENTIEVRLTFNKVTTSQFLTIKTLKEMSDFKIDHARYTSSSHTYVYTTFTWNSPSDEIDRYVFMCKRTSPTSDTTFYYTNREPDYPYVPSSNPLSLYGNDGWTEGIEGTNTTEFELQEYINNDYRIPIQVNHSYEIFVTGYKLDDNNKPVAVVSELIPLSFN